VLLVACTNLASMLLARAADRRKEIALRLAVGAGRGGLVRQLLTENLMIALLGGAGGALLAVWIADALAGWRPPIEFPLAISAAPDGRVFLFALLASVATTLVFGLVPALQATRTDLVRALKNEAISERFRRWHLRDYMVATQVCLSVVLLVCSVLVVRSLQRAGSMSKASRCPKRPMLPSPTPSPSARITSAPCRPASWRAGSSMRGTSRAAGAWRSSTRPS
jgi:predicted lysophospholipase L1 biosynthesis ABC-type transport system permease subunit